MSTIIFKRIVGAPIVGALIMHVVLSAFFYTTHTALQNTMLGKFYTKLVLIGPFFSEKKIQHSSHLVARYKSNTRWHPRSDINHYYFQNYLQAPWRFNQLAMNNYTRSLCKSISKETKNSKKDMMRSSLMKRLHDLIITNGHTALADSFEIVYTVKQYQAERNVAHYDTMFQIKYSKEDVKAFNSL